jgi:hypothetical protein
MPSLRRSRIDWRTPKTSSPSPPRPKGKQPAFGIPASAYLFDMIANVMLVSEHRKKIRQYL